MRVGEDVSPYQVWSLAGGLSEFVLPLPGLDQEHHDYLKGGNFFHPAIYADGGCLLAVGKRKRGAYAGFRVVREIRPELRKELP